MSKNLNWNCRCGQTNQTNFCSNCGEKRPHDLWICHCSTLNDEPICSNCGLSQYSTTHYDCDHCGLNLDGILNQSENLERCPSCGDLLTFHDQEWTI